MAMPRTELPPGLPAQARMASAPTARRGEPATLRALNRLLIRSVKALGDAGQTDLACRIAAEAWAALRNEQPDEAERLNGVLHYLTRPRPGTTKGDTHV
jgi:hypothetical protein